MCMLYGTEILHCHCDDLAQDASFQVDIRVPEVALEFDPFALKVKVDPGLAFKQCRAQLFCERCNLRNQLANANVNISSHLLMSALKPSWLIKSIYRTAPKNTLERLSTRRSACPS
jgi:hypothetical protein